jgi:hypothetical protein
MLCRGLALIGGGTVAVDGSRFKAVNTRDKNLKSGASFPTNHISSILRCASRSSRRLD